MNSRLKPGGLQSPLTEPTIIPLVLRCHNRLHDGSLGYVDRGIPISVLGMTASLTTENSLTLAVRFRTVATHMARPGCVAWVYELQWNASKSSLVGKELTQLSKAPGAMPCTLRVS